MPIIVGFPIGDLHVSMKSGLEGRNNLFAVLQGAYWLVVSMKSGLEGRNNP